MGIYSTAGPEMHSRWYFAKEGRTIPRPTRTHTGTCGQQEYLLNVGEQRMRKPSIQRAETLKRFESTSATNSQIEGPVWNIYEGGLLAAANNEQDTSWPIYILIEVRTTMRVGKKIIFFVLRVYIVYTQCIYGQYVKFLHIFKSLT